MALDYVLFVGSGLTPDGATRAIASAAVEALKPGHFTSAGLHLAVLTPHPLTVAMIQEGLGFEPSVAVSFRTAKDAQRQPGEDTMVRVVATLLALGHHDAALLFNGEAVVLQRIADDLVLGRDWTNLLAPRRIAGLPGAARWDDLPSCIG